MCIIIIYKMVNDMLPPPPSLPPPLPPPPTLAEYQFCNILRSSLLHEAISDTDGHASLLHISHGR